MTKSRGINAKPKRWTDADIHYLTELFPHHTTKAVAQILNISISRVNSKAHLIGLKKTPEHIKVFGGRLDGIVGAKTRFKPGNRPWTLGMTGVRLSPSSEFKKGQAPVNVQEVGALRINSLGDIEIKIAEGKGQWLSLRRYVWQIAHGPIPDDMCIVPIDGDGHNTALENLRLLTRAENIHHNLLARWPKELRSAMQLGGRLRKQIAKSTSTQLEAHHA